MHRGATPKPNTNQNSALAMPKVHKDVARGTDPQRAITEKPTTSTMMKQGIDPTMCRVKKPSSQQYPSSLAQHEVPSSQHIVVVVDQYDPVSWTQAS